MRWVAPALAAGVAFSVHTTNARAELAQTPVGQIVIDRTVIPFFLSDIERVDRLKFGDEQAVNVIFADRLDELLAEGTRGKVGAKIGVRLCGKFILAAAIEEELVEARFLIVVPEVDKANAFAADLLDPPCLRPGS